MASDSTRTLKDLVDAAQRGDPSAQFELGRRHYHGDGAPNDHAVAARWFGRAADQGHLVARIYLVELIGDDSSINRLADGSFDRWLRGAMDGLRKTETRRRELRDLQEVLQASRRRARRRAAVPTLIAAATTLAAAVWWWQGGF